MSGPPSPEEIFHAALQRDTAQARAAYLDESCRHDPALRRRVEHLLAAHLRAGGFLERPVASADPACPGPPSGPPGPEDRPALPAAAPRLDFLEPSSRPDALGRLGPFEVLEVVGEGGMGLVLRAFDAKLHRTVAIKTLAPALAALGPARRRFVREARTAASVIHENVIAIHSVEDDGAVPYLVMPFVDGPTLQQRLDRDGPQPLAEILRIGMQIASGLAAAHAQGLVHRDVKPANILLENGVERVKLTDFGLARVVDEPSLTLPGLIAGTPAYMSPEQAAGAAVDGRSDLFSLGSVLHALCTGEPPFRGESMLAILRRVCDESPRPVRRSNPEIPDWLESLIARLHAKDPEKRPRSAAEVAELLGRRLAELQEAGPAARRPPWIRWRAPLAALLVIATGLGAGEATGVTDVRGTVIRLFSPDGTLVVEVDDPAVKVAVEGTDLVITGAGAREIRLKPGAYRVRASKDGKLVRQELVEVARDGRKLVRISAEPAPPSESETWEKTVEGLPPEAQVRAVAERLRAFNPGFDGRLGHEIVDDEVVKIELFTDEVADLTPIRALRHLRTLWCNGSGGRKGKLADLAPLKGLPLAWLNVSRTQVDDLEPLRGMPLRRLTISFTRVRDLGPLRGMPLEDLGAEGVAVLRDLEPLRGMPLRELGLCNAGPIRDLGPLRGMPLQSLNLTGCPVTELAPLSGARTLRILNLDETPVADLSPIRDLPLAKLSLLSTPAVDYEPIRGMGLEEIRLHYRPELESVLRSLSGLKLINFSPPDEFWKANGAK